MRILGLVLSIGLLGGQNWPSFRGPGARGVAERQNLPVEWDAAKGRNIAWKTELPGLGLSSPIVCDKLVFLTTAVSADPKMVFEATLKGELDRRQDAAEQEFRVLAVDRGRPPAADEVVVPGLVGNLGAFGAGCCVDHLVFLFVRCGNDLPGGAIDISSSVPAFGGLPAAGYRPDFVPFVTPVTAVCSKK